MTLNEAIEYYDSLAEERRRKASIERNDYMDLRDESAEYSQLSEWLAELAVLREKVNCLELPNSSDDCISRQAAIDAVEHITSSMSVCVTTDECHGMKRMQRQAVIELANLPSAQPNLQPTRNQLATDCISRQAAIDALKSLPTWRADEGGYYGGAQPPMVALLEPEDAVSAIENLPSAQPEPSTEIEEILNYLDTTLHPIVSPDNWNVYAELHDMVSRLPSAQPEHALTADDIETIRIHLNAFKEKLCNQSRWNEAKEYEDLINRLLSTSSESQWTDSENTANETEK